MACHEREHLALLVVAGLLVAPLPAAAFEGSTHLQVANEVLKAGGTVSVNGSAYPLAAVPFQAIGSFPSDFRGGAVGPDGFPDIAFGQGTIHPDTRCANGQKPCGNGSFTHQWLWHLFQQAQVYRQRAEASGDPLVVQEAARAQAFTAGFLVHAASDLWGHTFANYYAGGVFPAVGDLVGGTATIHLPNASIQVPQVNENRRNIIFRHMVVEGYVGHHTAAGDRALSAPHDFLRRAFIWSAEPEDDRPCYPAITVPTPLASGTHFDGFLSLRKRLCDWKNSQKGKSWRPDCVYAKAWVRDINDGLYEWPGFAEEIARDLFERDDPSAAEVHAKDFGFVTVLSMVGVPDAVGSGLEVTEDVLTLVSRVLGPLDPLAPLKAKFEDWLFKTAFGLSLSEVKGFLRDPVGNIGNKSIGLGEQTEGLVQQAMGSPGGGPFTYCSPTGAGTCDGRPGFAPFANAVTASRLALLEPRVLDALLRDLRVTSLYTSPRLLQRWPDVGGQMQTGFMLGFLRSLDGNDGWRTRARDFEHPGASIQLGEGMPLWVDCYAREKAFFTLFQDSSELALRQVGLSGDECAYITDPFPSANVPAIFLALDPDESETPSAVPEGR